VSTKVGSPKTATNLLALVPRCRGWASCQVRRVRSQSTTPLVAASFRAAGVNVELLITQAEPATWVDCLLVMLGAVARIDSTHCL
jgi:hypothetical protein